MTLEGLARYGDKGRPVALCNKEPPRDLTSPADAGDMVGPARLSAEWEPHGTASGRRRPPVLSHWPASDGDAPPPRERDRSSAKIANNDVITKALRVRSDVFTGAVNVPTRPGRRATSIAHGYDTAPTLIYFPSGYLCGVIRRVVHNIAAITCHLS